MAGQQEKKKTTKRLRAFRRGKLRQRLGPKQSNVGKIRNNLGVVLSPTNTLGGATRGPRRETEDTSLPF